MPWQWSLTKTQSGRVGTDTPARIEFFGDTVDSIRSFDQETQLSTAQLAELEIAPMREFAVTQGDFGQPELGTISLLINFQGSTE